MRAGFVIYDGMTSLDLIGDRDPVCRLRSQGFVPDLVWEVCGLSKEVRDSNGLVFRATEAGKGMHQFPPPGSRRVLGGQAGNHPSVGP